MSHDCVIDDIIVDFIPRMYTSYCSHLYCTHHLSLVNTITLWIILLIALVTTMNLSNGMYYNTSDCSNSTVSNLAPYVEKVGKAY